MYDDRIRDVLLGFRMVSEGTTSASSDSDVGHGKRHSDGSAPPACDSDYEHWHHQFTSATSERQLEWRLLLAEQALTRAHKAPKHLGEDGLPELSEHRTMRILAAHGSPMEVAARFRCTASHVWILRWRDKRDPETGEPRPEDKEARRKAARDLRRSNHSMREIARQMNEPLATVGRWAKDAI